MDSSQTIAQFAHNLAFEDINPEALEIVRIDLLDTISTIIGGSGQPGAIEVVGMVQDWGGKAESTVLVYGDRVPAPAAALANGTMGHALDYDDTYDFATPLHAGVSVVPATLAAAERISGTTGREVMAAVAAGLEFMCRMSLATIGGLNRWHLTAVYGTLASALAAAKVMHLNEAGIAHALGIAYSSAAGNIQCIDDAALSKRLQAGLAAQSGVQAALLAECGLTGAVNTLEGENGLFATYHAGKYDRKALTKSLGSVWELERLSFKPWPCCRLTHPFITATLELVEEYNIKAKDVEEIVVAPSVLCEPLETKQSPRTIVDAQFSVPYTVARAVTGCGVTIADFTPAAIGDQAVLDLSQRVRPRDANAIKAGHLSRVTGAVVEIRLRDGTWREARVEYPFGNPDDPMPLEAFVSKLEDCATVAARPIDQVSTNSIVSQIGQLEDLADVGDLMATLVFSTSPDQHQPTRMTMI